MKDPKKVLRPFIAGFEAIKRDITQLTPKKIVEVIAVAVIIIQIAILAVNGLHGGHPILGLKLDGHTIGRISGLDYRKQMLKSINSKENAQISLKVATYKTMVTPRQLGATVDRGRLMKTILMTGRSGNIFKRIIDQDVALFGALSITSQVGQPNEQLASAYIMLLNSKIATHPTNAYFSMVNKAVAVKPDVPGVALNSVQAVTSIISAAGNKTAPQSVELPTQQTQAMVTSSMLEPLKPQVQSIVQTPLTITAGPSTTTLSPDQLLSVVEPKVTPDAKDPQKNKAQISFDLSKLNATVDTIVGSAVVSPQPTIVNRGKVIVQGKSGLQAEDDHPTLHVLNALVQRETGNAPAPSVEIPLVKVDPPVVPSTAATPSSFAKTPGTVYLSFDDGPGQYTEQVLDILKKYGVHARFYLVGRNVLRYPQSVKRMVAEGHVVANHSFTHTDLTTLSAGEVQRELLSTQDAIRSASGVTPKNFRPPYGAQNSTVKSVVASLGLTDDLWSVDPRDWSQPGSDAITQRVLSKSGPGSVILLHVLHQQTVDALPAIIQGLRAKGLTLN